MFKMMEDLPEDVVGFEASGKVTHEDYKEKLIPLLEKKLAEGKPLKMIYAVGVDFDGFELAAMWDDAAFGIKHWKDVSHIALVTDERWLSAMTAFWAPFYPGVVRIFSNAELDHAKEWICAAEKKEAA